VPHSSPSFLLHFVTVVILDEVCELWSSLLCSFIRSPLPSSLLTPKYLHRCVLHLIHSRLTRPYHLWGPPNVLLNGNRGKAAESWGWSLTLMW
jgi:hypothetical protein